MSETKRARLEPRIEPGYRSTEIKAFTKGFVEEAFEKQANFREMLHQLLMWLGLRQQQAQGSDIESLASTAGEAISSAVEKIPDVVNPIQEAVAQTPRSKVVREIFTK